MVKEAAVHQEVMVDALVADVAEVGHNMKKIISIINLAIVISVLSPTVEADSTLHWLNDRDYSLSVSDDSNQPILLIAIEYQGKRLLDDVDVYHESFKNLTNSTINIHKISYSMDRGRLYTALIKGDEKIQAMYGSSDIKPKGSLHRYDAWVWAKKDNKLHRVYHFRQLEINNLPIIRSIFVCLSRSGNGRIASYATVSTV